MQQDNKRKFGSSSSDNPQQKANDPPPPSYSWRNRGVLPSILTQPPRSCWGVATKTVLEAILKIQFGYTVPLSLQYLLDHVTPFEANQKLVGSTILPDGFEYIKRHGMCTQKDYPYKGFKQYGLPHPTRYDIIESVVSLNPEEGEKIRATIVEHPIYGLLALPKSVDKFKFKGKDDVYRATEEEKAQKIETNHAVVVSGYEVDTGCYDVLNSAGHLWGDGGHGKIEESLFTHFYYPIVKGGWKEIHPSHNLRQY